MRLVAAACLLIGLLPNGVFAGGLERVKQIIFGMDCAPCAYSVEEGLNGLSGVEEVTVSLNEGYAEVHFGKDSRTALAGIREVIRKNGFTPKDADVHVSGNVVESNDGRFLLRTGVETFELNFKEQIVLSQLSGKDSSVTVTGSVAAGQGRRLRIEAIEQETETAGDRRRQPKD